MSPALAVNQPRSDSTTSTPQLPSTRSMTMMELLSKSLEKIRSTPPRMIASPPTQPRRAAVAIIIRVVSSHPKPSTTPSTLSDFFEQDWVKDPSARPEILFLKRDNTQDGHLAFPGGRMEEEDEGSLYTAMRQTWEEIGIDLAEKDFMCVGQLDDREITTSLGKRLLMILSPFVFLHLSPTPPTPDPLPATSLHWTPISALIAPTKWSFVSVDAASRLAPKNSVILRILVRLLVGTMRFPAIVLYDSSAEPQPFIPHSILEKGIRPPPPPPALKLWGLSLGMVLDLLSFMGGPDQEKDHLPALPFQESMSTDLIPPSLASVFPRFSYPDVNFWIWVFGKRYREVISGWESSVRAGGTNDRRINWAGSALSTFYAAVRKALVVVILLRAICVIFGVAMAVWWVFK